MTKSFSTLSSALGFMALFGLASLSPAAAISDSYRSLSARLVSQAEAQLAADKLAKADELLNLALTANPGNARAYVVKGQAQGRLDNKEEALRLIGVGLDIEPGDLAALRLQGDAALAIEDIEQAEKSLSVLRRLCAAPCQSANELAAAIAQTQTAGAENSQPESSKKD
ncbi:MAG: hypothetical protein P8N62_05640 [Alphaproteobacteria bacterium]|jgi:tetratricopeptide (TPR) repeat protein|nr:hypothetical protein [Alphaproteobacteria bacterium]